MIDHLEDRVTIVVACHTERRWTQLEAAVQSVRQDSSGFQTQLVVVVDHNDALLARAKSAFVGAQVIPNRYARGASGARNTGAFATETEFVAFLDDDATALDGWLAELLVPFGDESVVGTGGFVTPAWERGQPQWFPSEFGWVVGASYRGMPGAGPIRNVWSENMAVRANAFRAVGGFRVGFGKVGDRSRPEDTDLCLRMAASSAGAQWVYVPTAAVVHAVPASRSTFAFYVRRCFHEGSGKVEMANLHLGSSLGSERSYAVKAIPKGIARELTSGVRGHPAGFLRAAACAIGLGAAATGAVWESRKQVVRLAAGATRNFPPVRATFARLSPAREGLLTSESKIEDPAA